MTNEMKRRAPIPRGPPYHYRPAYVHAFVGRARHSVRAAARHSFFGFHHLPFHVPNRRKPHNWLADSGQLSRCNYLVDVFVSWACFLGEACP